MSARRLRIVQLLIATLIGASVFEILIDHEHWPFSSYQMFSSLRGRGAFSHHRLVGVTADAPAREFPLIDPAYLAPFDSARLGRACTRIAKRPDAERAFRTAVADCLRRYERRRLAGDHRGPPLSAMRLYLLGWQPDPWARNVDAPDSRELIVEVTRSALVKAR